MAQARAGGAVPSKMEPRFAHRVRGFARRTGGRVGAQQPAAALWPLAGGAATVQQGARTIGIARAGRRRGSASLLFYKAAVYHRLLAKDGELAALTRLLENEQTIPQRYATLARLMQADLGALKTDSLDEIARLMDSIHIRLGHGRAGRRVRQEEDDVVAKLDKLIEEESGGAG